MARGGGGGGSAKGRGRDGRGGAGAGAGGGGREGGGRDRSKGPVGGGSGATGRGKSGRGSTAGFSGGRGGGSSSTGRVVKPTVVDTVLGSIDPNITAQTPGSTPNFPLADPLYGPTRLLESIGPMGVLTAPLKGLGVLPSATDTLGLQQGPQAGWAASVKKEDTADSVGNAGDSFKDAEERKRKRALAQQTLLGTTTESTLGANVLPITT